jgi:hypothetical protein
LVHELVWFMNVQFTFVYGSDFVNGKH